MAEDRIEVDTGTSELLCEIRDRVALITLNRPEARNALSDRLTPALRRMNKLRSSLSFQKIGTPPRRNPTNTGG
jgi:hypothetical protein